MFVGCVCAQARATVPAFSLPFTIRHEINEESPLHDVTDVELVSRAHYNVFVHFCFALSIVVRPLHPFCYFTLSLLIDRQRGSPQAQGNAFFFVTMSAVDPIHNSSIHSRKVYGGRGSDFIHETVVTHAWCVFCGFV